MNRRGPVTFGTAAESRLEEAVADYRDSLVEHATAAAQRRSADQVSAAHVEIARATLEVMAPSRTRQIFGVAGASLFSLGTAGLWAEASGSRRAGWIAAGIVATVIGSVLLTLSFSGPS
jgi:hypothetical protein